MNVEPTKGESFETIPFEFSFCVKMNNRIFSLKFEWNFSLKRIFKAHFKITCDWHQNADTSLVFASLSKLIQLN